VLKRRLASRANLGRENPSAKVVVFGLIFLGFVIAEVAVLIPHLLLQASVEGSFLLLTALTIVTAVIFLVEGIRFKRTSRY